MSPATPQGPSPSSAHVGTGCEYELVPLLELPQVDLAISVKSCLPRIRLLHRILRSFMVSPLTIIGYLTGLLLTLVVFFVPLHIGRVMAIIALIIGIPGTLVGIATLRYETIVVLLHTYDIWFFGAILTLVMTLLCSLISDVRAVLAIICFPSFFVNIFIDANLVGVRNLWIANSLSGLCFFAVAVSVSTGMMPGMHRFDVVAVNGHSLPAAALARDGLLSMIAVIVRNVYRRFFIVVKSTTTTTSSSEELTKTSPTLTTIKCVSFRCRLQARQLPQRRLSQIPNNSSPGGTSPSQHDVRESVVATGSTKTQMRFVPFLQPLDVRNTLLPLPSWLWRNVSMTTSSPHTSSWRRRFFQWVGLFGFVNPIAGISLGLASPRLAQRPDVVIAVALSLCASLFFTSVCLALCNRQLFKAVATSFDFVYLSSQLAVVHLAVADLCRWQMATTLSLVATWDWCMWLLYWDALLPPVRVRLGLSHRVAAWVATVLFVTMVATATVMFLILPPHSLNDRVVVEFTFLAHPIQFRVLSWYFSCGMTISTWVVRLLWRLWRATDAELVVLDGPVVYDYAMRARKTPAAGIDTAPHAVVPARIQHPQ